MKFTSEDCKEFISKKAHQHHVPLVGWKRISKTKNTLGYLRVFKHSDGSEIEILENTQSKCLAWLSTKKINSIETNEYDFSDLPQSIQIFTNTLRSLMGKSILEKESFSAKHLNIWNSAIQERNQINNNNSDNHIPPIYIFDKDFSDDVWNILQDIKYEKNVWNDDRVMKYMSQYFWYCFSNDPRDEDKEYPHLFIAPKGFSDDGRIPMIFEQNINQSICAPLSEIMESTVEFTSTQDHQNEQLKESYQFMKLLGIEFSFSLQKTIKYSEEAHRDFSNKTWIEQNLHIQSKNKLRS